MIRRAGYVFLFVFLACLGGCRKDAEGPSETRSSASSPAPQAAVTAPNAAAGSPEEQYASLNQQLEQGHYDGVIQRAQERYLSFKNNEPVWAWRFRLLQARASIRGGESAAALDLLRLQPPAGLPVEDFARREIVSAEALCVLGKHRDGIATLSQARPLLPPEAKDPVLNAEWLFFRGRCEEYTSEAFRNYNGQAARLARGKDKFLEAAAEGNLGFRLLQLQRFDEATDHLKVVLKLAQAMNSPLLEERALGYLGQSYFELGDYQKAGQYSMRAENIAADLGIAEHRARHLIDIGHNEEQSGKLSEAEDDYLRAISLMRKGYERKDAGAKALSNDVVARCLNNLTSIELRRGDLDKAADYHRQAAPLIEGGESLFVWKMNRIDLELGRKDFSSARKALAEFLSDKPGAYNVRWLAESKMASLSEAQGQMQEAEKWYRMAIATGVAAASKLNRREYRTVWLSNLPFYNNYIEFLARGNRPLQALQVAEIGRARAVAKDFDAKAPEENTAVWLARIQAGLKRKGKVALAYWTSDTDLYTWLVTPAEVKLVRQQHGRQEMQRLVAGYQKEIELHNSITESPMAARLYEILVQPFASLMPNGAHVVIVADSNLYDVNFESLIVPGARPHYWIEDVTVENAISLRRAIESRPRLPRYKKDMLAIGAPIQVSREFPPLPHAPEEIEKVTGPFPAALEQVFTAERATPQAFLTAKPESYRYIHFVAHGTKVPLEPLDSAIILSRDQNDAYKLYARDIAGLKHPITAELVTISSCDSAGVTTNQLGGPIGLSWAFAHAGARQVIAALWKVDDAATPQLMDRFYRELATGKKATEALRDAKLAMLRSNGPRKKPYYWATLQLFDGS